ncbi:unnamed protein product, partial [Closterium sp. Yama58-4]
MGVGVLRGPSAHPPSAPPPCKLPRRPPDLSSRLAAVLQNINPPRSAPSPWPPFPPSTKPGLSSPATPAAPAAPAPPSASACTAAARIEARESRLVVGGSRGDASGFMGSTLVSSTVHTSDAAVYGYDQRVQWPASVPDNNALGRNRLSAAHSNPLRSARNSALQSAASRASVTAPHVVAFGPERPLRVDASGMLPLPACGAREGMLKQQLMALAEAMAVDDSV